jgi:L-fuculose-phosphate aldolase
VGDLLLADEREAVAEGSRRLAAKGLVIGTAGNVSARRDDLVAVTPTGADLAEITPDIVTVVDFEGNIVDGPYAPTSEVPMHMGIYRATDALAITHAHAMASTAIACVHDELPPVHYTALELGGVPRVAAYATFGSEELATNVTAALDGRNAALMANHGSIAYGADMATACYRLELLEWHAELYWRAASLGEPRLLTDKDIENVNMPAIAGGYGRKQAVEPSEGER